MSTLSTMGMNTSRAQLRMYIAAAIATTVSATLRTLTSIGEASVAGVGTGTSGLARSATAGRLRLAPGRRRAPADGKAGSGLQRLVDGDSRLRAFGGGDDHELHVARGVAHDVEAGNARLTEVIGVHRALVRQLAAKLARELAPLTLRTGEEGGVEGLIGAIGEGEPPEPSALVLQAGDAR